MSAGAGKVELKIMGRSYTLGCAPGEEDRLRDLGQRFENRVSDISGTVGDLGELRLMLAAGISFLDELDEARSGRAPTQNDDDVGGRLVTLERTAAAALNEAANRINEIARRIEKAS